MVEHAKGSSWYASWFDTPYYHILYGDRDYSEAAAFMVLLTRALDLQPNSHILDLACGRGRHSLQLHKLGYRVTGVDLSPSSIAYARETIKSIERDHQSKNENTAPPDLNFEVHDMTLPYPVQVDAVFNLFTSFGYFDDEADNLKTICAIKKSLKPGGWAVIDFLNAPYTLQHLVAANNVVRQGINFHLSRQVDQGYIVKTIAFQDQGTQYQFKEEVRALTLNDFKELYASAGIALKHCYGSYHLEPYDPINSQRLIMVLHKD